MYAWTNKYNTDELFFFPPLYIIYHYLPSSLFISSLLFLHPSHRWLCPSLAHVEAGSSHRPGPLKHSSGRIHQRTRPALLMQMCSHTLIENLRDCGPWNIFFLHSSSTERHTYLRMQLRHMTKHTPSPPPSSVLLQGSVIFGLGWDICHWGVRVVPG